MFGYLILITRYKLNFDVFRNLPRHSRARIRKLIFI